MASYKELHHISIQITITKLRKKKNNPTEPDIPYKYRHNVNQVGFGRNPDIMKFNYDAQDEKDYLDRVRQWKYRKYLKPLYTSNAQYSGTTTP